MHFAYGKQTAIGAAVVAGIALIGGLTWALFPRYVPGPQDVLPADRTLAVVITPDRTLLSVLERYTPSVLPPNAATDGTSYALVKLDDNATAWVALRPSGTEELMTVTSDNQAAVDLVRRESVRLSSDADFRTLAIRGMKAQAFVRPEALHALPASGPFRQTSHPILIASDDDLTWKFRIERMRGALPESFLAAGNRPFFTLHAANLKAFIGQIGASFDADASAAFGATFTRITTEMLGSDISARYDLLPLFDGPSSVQIASTGSGTAFAMQTVVSDADDADDLLERLHAAQAGALASPERVDLTFDDQFSITSMREGGDVISEEVRLGGYWDAIMTHRNGRGLFSATRGRDVIVSNDAAMFSGMVESTAQMIQSPSGTVAAGIASVSAMESMMHDLLNGMTLPAGSGGILHFSVMEGGDTATVRLQ